MAEKRLNAPRDPLQLGKLIVDIATGEVDDRVVDERESKGVAAGNSEKLRGPRQSRPAVIRRPNRNRKESSEGALEEGERVRGLYVEAATENSRGTCGSGRGTLLHL
jgi:hypothetical protein